MLGQRVNALGDPQTFELEVTQESSSVPEAAIPASPDDFIEEARERNDQMEGEGSEWASFSEAVSLTVNDFLESAPDGLNFGDATSCTGAGVSTGTGGTTYSVERVVGSTSYTEEPEVTKTEGGNTVVVGTVNSPGRMGGDWGWSSDKNLIVGALASFSHNWVASLLAYFDRPSLPYNPDGEGWKLPNLVLNETEEPDQFLPTASFSYNLRPSMYRQFTASITAPQKSTVGIEMWDSNKEQIARVEETEIPKGQTSLVITSTGYNANSGFLNINPLDAPSGLAVSDVSAIPRAL